MKKLIVALLVTTLSLTSPVMASTLKRGDSSDKVRKLQEALIENGYLSGNADGQFGPMTEDAVKLYQQLAGVSDTGVINDIQYLNITHESSNAPGKKATNYDYSDWKRLLVHYGSRRYREYKLELNNFAGKYSATEILLDNSCCIFSKMAGLKMPDYLNSEDESLMQECLKPEVRFSTINGLSEPSVYDIQVPRFGALCLKLHQLPD